MINLDKIPTDYAGVNVLLMGPSGTGKTYQIASLVETGIEVCAIFTENSLESLIGYWADQGKPVPDNLYWMLVEAPQSGIQALVDGATKVNSMTLDTLLKIQDPNRMKHNGFINLLNAMNDFTDVRTGRKFPPVDTWDNRRALAIDSLSGVNNLAMSMVIGSRPARSQSDWGMAQDQIEKFLHLSTQFCKCHFILTAHVEREQDMVLGGIKLMVSTLGKALAPKIPAMFSDVILTVREGTTWYWSTASSIADLKTRNLAYNEKITPGFAQIIEKWQNRALSATVTKPETEDLPKA